MKTTIFGTLILIFLTSCSNAPLMEKNNADSTNLVSQEVISDDILDTGALISQVQAQDSDLSEIEISSLILMREEEKLARDVYLELYDIWGQQIFTNIAASEQSHTDAVKTLLDRYDIADPMVNDTRGVFESNEMQELYDILVEKGQKSLLDALMVGATIEDLDIKDLQEFSKVIDNEYILIVYDNLERGSRNHMRSFTKNISRLGGTYIPQYISQAEYDSIISSQTERGGK